MRPFIGMCCLYFIFYHQPLRAQNDIYYCASSGENQNEINSSTSPCFDVDDIFNNCKPVYIRVNLHFFVNDNCNGPVQQMGKNQKDIYKIAEEMINAANNNYEKNEAQWQLPNAVAHCVPIRLVLKGIFTHCKSNAVGIYNVSALNQEFGVNKSTAINFYIADTDDGASGVGLHYERCGSATYFNKESWWTVGNFVHEMGHILTLSHSFESDGCDDTPKISYDWDKNCNGILENFNDRQLDETNITCWSKLEPNKKKGEEGYSDINKNNVHDCDEQAPCTACPCCKAEFIDNNVMSYSSNKSALTDCQIKKMLGDLSGYNCNLIEKIGNCPPASSFITQTPEDINNKSACRECLILEASVNEDEYELKIYEKVNGQEILVHDGGWISGQAGSFCYRTGIAFQGLKNYLKPNTDYIAYLKTRNKCSENTGSYSFKTNTTDCGSLPFESLTVNPNPGFNQLVVEFYLNDTDNNIQAVAKNIMTGNTFPLLIQKVVINGSNQINLDISNLPVGSYSLLLIGDHSLFQNNFVKM